MFGFGQKKNKTDKRSTKPKKLQVGCNEGCKKLSTSDGQSLAGDALRAQALANARKAREALGEETVQKIADAIAKKENNPFEQAKRQLENVDSDRVADEILAMLDDK
ncbi:MAG: hypothetical protein R3E13_11895 [Alphaproteobacteria bacterium]